VAKKRSFEGGGLAKEEEKNKEREELKCVFF
jgi:hypothetical protein